jgi:CRISPR type III-A-associated RAMP protein Csm4
MKIHTYKLFFNAPLHISNERADYGIGTSTIHNDTLYAAIMQCWSLLGKQDWIPKVANEIPFVTSSLFPFSHDTFFFPRPMYKNDSKNVQLDLETKIVKKIKKAIYIDTTILENMLQGKVSDYHTNENFQGEYWSANPLTVKPITSQVMPRSKVQEGKDTDIFYIERFYFAANSGLYFLANFENEDAKTKFDVGLRLLADEGIGTDRNVGHGKFTIQEIPTSLPNLVSKAKLSINLGMYCPTNLDALKNSFDNPNCGYDIAKRGGWLSEPHQTWRKRSVYMLKPGAILQSNSADKIESAGKIVDLKPDSLKHPVWRNGKTLFLNF